MKKFECLALPYQAIEAGHSYQVVLNAADEILVDAFLKQKISFTDISYYMRKTLEKHRSISLTTVEDILELDREIKRNVQELIQ